MKNISSLKKKLAGYSAITGAILAANHHPSSAQVIYHDIVPDTVLTDLSPDYDFDLNNDSIVDLSLAWTSAVATFSRYGNIYLAPSVSVLRIPGASHWDPLNSCENIFAVPLGSDHWTTGSAVLFQPNGTSFNGADFYAGIKLHLSDGNHYGWIRMTCIFGNYGYDGSITIKDYAYQSTPDSSIRTPCASAVDNVDAPDLFSMYISDHQLIVHFNLPLPYQFILVNDLGMKLNEQSITQAYLSMDVSELTSGIYFVEVVSDKQRQVKKVVIQ